MALTANALLGDRDRCLASGADDYLNKPVTPAALHEVLERCLGASAEPTAANVAQRMLETLGRVMDLDGHEMVVSPFIGIAVYPQHGRDAETLLKNADTAMYSARRGGKNHFQFYDEPMNACSLNRLTMETHLRKASSRNELELHYQPQLEVSSGLILSIGEWALRTACTTMMSWRQARPDVSEGFKAA